MISSFADNPTRLIFEGRVVTGVPPDIQQRARRKLRMVDAALKINDLRSPPGNRLEVLEGDRAGIYSIRINNQWRICFRWEAGNTHEVEISKHYE